MKKLLMITRRVDKNDALAGFAYNWIEKIGEGLDKLYVISWQKGDASDLPNNIEVIFLPDNKLLKIFLLKINTFKILLKADGLFCHMNPEYTIIAAPIARLMGKRVVSWYTHKEVNWKRRLLEILANKIITASDLSFRDPWFSKKLKVIGHGIDTEKFRPNSTTNDGYFDIVSVGRISPTKDYESIIKAMSDLDNNNIRLKIIGDVILKPQQVYFDNLKKMVEVMNLANQVEFIGWVSNRNIVPYYQTADLFINMSQTGSLDKAVLEAMACGCLVLTANEAFKEILPDELMVEKDNPKKLVEKIKYLINLSEEKKQENRNKLRAEVVTNHNLDNLAKKIIKQFD